MYLSTTLQLELGKKFDLHLHLDATSRIPADGVGQCVVCENMWSKLPFKKTAFFWFSVLHTMTSAASFLLPRKIEPSANGKCVQSEACNALPIISSHLCRTSQDALVVYWRRLRRSYGRPSGILGEVLRIKQARKAEAAGRRVPLP